MIEQWMSPVITVVHMHKAPIPEEEPLPGDEPIPEEEEVPHPDPVIMRVRS